MTSFLPASLSHSLCRHVSVQHQVLPTQRHPKAVTAEMKLPPSSPHLPSVPLWKRAWRSSKSRQPWREGFGVGEEGLVAFHTCSSCHANSAGGEHLEMGFVTNSSRAGRSSFTGNKLGPPAWVSSPSTQRTRAR